MIVALLSTCTLMGCQGETPPTVRGPSDTVFPAPEGTFEEDLAQRKGHGSPPSWITRPMSYSGAAQGRVYFSGVGEFRMSERDARDSAEDHARRQVARYLGTQVGVKTVMAGVAKGDTRGTGYEAVTEEVLSKAVSEETVKGLLVRDFYLEGGMLVRNIAKRRMYRGYVLVEFGGDPAKEVVQSAKAATGSEIQQLKKQLAVAPPPTNIKDPKKRMEIERKQVRLDSLERLQKKLDGLDLDDFKL
jgi:hypothetical protein